VNQWRAHQSLTLSTSFETTSLEATPGRRKRKRKVKEPSDAATTREGQEDDVFGVTDGANEPLSDEEKELIGQIAKFKFKPKSDDLALPPPDLTPASSNAAAPPGTDTSIPLPDIKETIKRKELEEELAKMEQDAESKKVKIKRTDRVALAKLLEQDPYADADDSFFEEESYGTISALLGERAKSFVGIPSGPLQVGHFIGALVIVLMAFVEYPGFPLTNLPTPLRESLQGGLATIYTINIGLAVWAVFKANERGQSPLLWGVKTFSVGGLALDQLTQLPTLEQIKAAESRKGARALKKNKRR